MFKRTPRVLSRKNRHRLLTFEGLDRREMMDAAGLGVLAAAAVAVPNETTAALVGPALPASSATSTGLAGAQASATVLAKGTVQIASITKAGEVDAFTFTAKAGETIELAMARYSISNFVPCVKVYYPDGSLWQTLSPNGLTGEKRLVVPKGMSGTFRVEVQDNNLRDTGQYKLGLESISPPSLNPIALKAGKIAKRQITESIQKDQFVFTASSRQTIELAVARNSISNFKPKVQIFYPNGTLWKTLTVNGLTGETRLAVPKGIGGQFVVQVQDDNLLDIGDYKIGLESISPPSADASPLKAGKAVTRTIGESIAKDQFTFQAKARDTIKLTIERKSISNFVPEVRVFYPDGTLWKTFTVNGLAGEARLTVPKGVKGLFLVQVQDNNLLDTGKYTLSLKK